MQTTFDVIVFSAGFVACWLCKNPLLRLVKGAAASIEAIGIKLATLRRSV